MTEEQMKTYLVKHGDGTEQKVTVPESWKVTFGPAARGERGDRAGLKMPMALRFYESETKQRAIFTDIVSFRDTSIKVEEKKVRTQEKDGYMECEGARKRTTFRAHTVEWVNPDEVIEQKALPPSDIQMFDMSDTEEVD